MVTENKLPGRTTPPPTTSHLLAPPNMVGQHTPWVCITLLFMSWSVILALQQAVTVNCAQGLLWELLQEHPMDMELVSAWDLTKGFQITLRFKEKRTFVRQWSGMQRGPKQPHFRVRGQRHWVLWRLSVRDLSLLLPLDFSPCSYFTVLEELIIWLRNKFIIIALAMSYIHAPYSCRIW